MRLVQCTRATLSDKIEAQRRLAPWAGSAMVMHPLMVERVEAALDEIRPALEMDGGAVELIEITAENKVRLAMVGACAGCPMSAMTLRLGIERLIRERVPEVTDIETEGATDLMFDD